MGRNGLDCQHLGQQADVQQLTAFLDERGFPRTTRRTYSDVLCAVLGFFAGRDLGSLTASDFRSLAQDRLWKPATVRLAHMTTRSYLRWLGAKDAPVFEFKVGYTTREPQRTLTPEQKSLLLTACGKTRAGKQLALMVETLWHTWVRCSELCSIRVEDIDLKRNVIRLRGKGGSWREVPLTPYIASRIEAWLSTERPQMKGADGPTLFLTYSGRAFTRESVRTVIRRLGERVGLRVSPHDFRRGACTDAVRRGMPTVTAQKAGGWSSPQMVATYTRGMTTDDLRAAMERWAA